MAEPLKSAQGLQGKRSKQPAVRPLRMTERRTRQLMRVMPQSVNAESIEAENEVEELIVLQSQSAASASENVDANPLITLEENMQKAAKQKELKHQSAVKASVNLVEQVACYKCKFCPFLSLSQDAVAAHVQREHAMQLPSESNSEIQCPGCSNVFYSQKSLRVHLSEDHNVAQEELENILSSITTNVVADDTKRNLETIAKEEQQKQDERLSGRNNSAKFSKSVGIVKGNIQVSPPKNSGAEKRVQYIRKPIIPDETRKIRVRKMSSLEKSEQQNIDVEFMEIEATDIGVNSSQTVSASESQGNSSSAGSCLVESNRGENIHMYDIESMEILDIPLDQQQNEPEVELIEELDVVNPGGERTLQSVVVDSDGRYCTVAASPSTCDKIIDELCQEEVLENVLYVKSHIVDERDSPILVCYAASPDDIPGNDDYEDEPMDDMNSVGSENVNKDMENNSEQITLSRDARNHHSERIILSSCSLEGSDFVGLDGKKLVKRGFVKRSQAKTSRSKKPKVLKNRPNNTDSNEEGVSMKSYRCNVYGCAVRLLAHENMEYHRRCHVPMAISENTLKASIENENLSGSKRGRVSLSKRYFTCPECSAEIHSWKQTKMHLWKHHSIDIELHTCDLCGYKCPSLSSLNNTHVKIHGSEKPCLCDICGKGFKTTKQLRNHKTIHIRKDQGSQAACDICGRTFHTNRMLRSHIDTVHNKLRPYMCSECGHTAANRSSLKMHLRQHTGDRPYGCDQCDYKTADHNSLRRHKKRHTGDKPYKCPHCSYACIQSSTFKIHLRSKHPDQASSLMFSCKECPFHSVSHDMYLAHVAEHSASEECGVPLKSAPKPARMRLLKPKQEVEESTLDEIPIYVSIEGKDFDDESQQSNFENIVQHVSEAIVPGSNLHVLYNSISLSDSNSKQSTTSSSGAILLQNSIIPNPIMQIINDSSELQFVAEISNSESAVEMPTEELEYKIPEHKFQSCKN